MTPIRWFGHLGRSEFAVLSGIDDGLEEHGHATRAIVSMMWPAWC